MQTNLSIVHIPYESHLCFPLVCLHVGQKCFYRAMLYMHRADYIPSQDVCLSVTRRYSIDTAEHIVNFFTTRSPHHSSFSTPNSMAIFRRDPPPNGCVECKGQGVWKNRDFRPISRFISEMMKLRAIHSKSFLFGSNKNLFDPNKKLI